MLTRMHDRTAVARSVPQVIETIVFVGKSCRCGSRIGQLRKLVAVGVSDKGMIGE